MKKQRIEPGQKIELKLTEAERQNVLDDLNYLEPELEAIVRSTSAGEPIMLTLDDLDQLGECVAAEANHTKSRKLRKSLDGIYGKITVLLDKYADAPPSKPLSVEEAKKDTLIAEQAAQITQWLAQAAALGEQLRIKTKVVTTFVPGTLDRAVLSNLPAVATKVRRE